MNIAIIPARGGSKRIKGKNVRSFCGKPIIEYSIKAARQSEIFDEIMVSTESKEIASLASDLGATVPFLRSDENASDMAGTAEVISEVLDRYRQLDQEFLYGCCIYPTAPFLALDTTTLRAAALLIEQQSFDVVLPVVRFSYPVFRGVKLEASGRVSPVWPEYMARRSQDLPEVYHDAGQFYMFRCAAFLSSPVLFGENTGALPISEAMAQDIDTEEDWRTAERKFRWLQAEQE